MPHETPGTAASGGAEISRRVRPVLVFDGDCAFCTACARAIEQIGADVDVAAWQLTDLDRLGLTAEQAAEAVRLVGPDGDVRTGHEAIAGALARAGGVWRALARVLVQPGASWLAARAYAVIASNRSRLPGATPACDRHQRREPGD